MNQAPTATNDVTQEAVRRGGHAHRKSFQAPSVTVPNIGQPWLRFVRRLTAFTLLMLSTAGILLAGSGAASASVYSGQGSSAYAFTRCTPGPNATILEIEAHVGQDRTGQSVGAAFWAYDSRGWHVSNVTQVATSPATWSYDNMIHFKWTFYGLTGRVTAAYVQYYWYRSTGWVSSGEPVGTGC